MDVNEKELKDRRIQLDREIDRLQTQLQQAQAIPLQIASRKGEVMGIDRILQKTPEEKAKNLKQESDK